NYAIPPKLGESEFGRQRSIKVLESSDWGYSKMILPGFKPGPRKSTLGNTKTLPGFRSNLSGDEALFPVILWLREILTAGVKQLVLNNALIGKASPPGQG